MNRKLDREPRRQVTPEHPSWFGPEARPNRSSAFPFLGSNRIDLLKPSGPNMSRQEKMVAFDERDSILQYFYGPKIAGRRLEDIPEYYKSLQPSQEDSQEVAASKQEKLRVMHDNFALRMGNMFGIDTDIVDKEARITKLSARIDEAMHDANEVLARFDSKKGWLGQYSTSIGMDSDIERERDPLQLIAYAVDSNIDTRKRYEALRKFKLAETALHASQDFREADVFMDWFLENLIGRHLQAQDELGGAKTQIRVVSDHSPINYNCDNVMVLHNGDRVGEPDAYRRFTEFTMRSFFTEVPVETEIPETAESYGVPEEPRRVFFHVSHRVKDTPSKVIKMLRKNVEDPQSIDDSIGLKLVFESTDDIHAFINKLKTVSAELGSYGRLEQPSSSVDKGDKFPTTNVGSSDGFEVIKAHYRVGGRLVELQLFTFQSYFNSEYRDGDAYNEYVLNRTFDSQAVDLLYPEFLRDTQQDKYGQDGRRLPDYSILYKKTLDEEGNWVKAYKQLQRRIINSYRAEVRVNAPRIPDSFWEPIQSRVAGVIYRVRDGEIEILAERKKGAGGLKLPGGDYRDSDESLFYTFEREMREEMGLELDRKFTVRLPDAEVDYVETDNHPSFGAKKLVMRGFGYRIDDLNFTPVPIEADTDIDGFEWVSVDHFVENSRYESYKRGLIDKGWISLVKAIEQERQSERPEIDPRRII